MKSVVETAQFTPAPPPAPPQIENHNLEKGVAYRFCGNGLGVPGLPHEISREQADRDGIMDLLDAAIAAGVYQTVAAEADKE